MNEKVFARVKWASIAIVGLAANGAALVAVAVGFLMMLTVAMTGKAHPTRTEFLIEIWPLAAGVVGALITDVLIAIDRWKTALMVGIASAGVVAWYLNGGFGP